MARTRLFKPDFYDNEELGRQDFAAQLLFAGLWLHADRDGRLHDRPGKFKKIFFGYRDDITPEHVDTFLESLAKNPEQFIIRYEIGGEKYIQITNFHKHQNPHKNEPESKIPPPMPVSSNNRDITRGQSEDSNSALIPLAPIPSDQIPSDPILDAKNSTPTVENPPKPSGAAKATPAEGEKKNKRAYSAECKTLVSEFKAFLKSRGRTVFARDWDLTCQASCESLLRQGKTPDQITKVYRWAITTWPMGKTVTHFAHVVKAWGHYEAGNPRVAFNPAPYLNAKLVNCRGHEFPGSNLEFIGPIVPGGMPYFRVKDSGHEVNHTGIKIIER